MTNLDRILAKPHKFLLWAFTGLIVTTTVITLFEPFTSTTKSIEKGKKSKKKTHPKKKTPEEEERDSRDVTTWNKKELFDYLTRHQVYPDVDVSRDELVRLVKSIKNLYPDIDF